MRNLCALAAVGLISACSSALAITAGQTDNFQDGTVQNWSGGAGPINVGSGGPAGAADKFLKLTSSNHMATYNLTQWSGDYSTPGITDINADLMDFVGQASLQIRLVVFSGSLGQWTSTNAVTVPSDGAWHHFTFSMRAADMTSVSGTDTFTDTLSAANRLMFRHDDGVPSSQGTAFVGSMGIDNVKALSVPEPGAIAALGFIALSAFRRRR